MLYMNGEKCCFGDVKQYIGRHDIEGVAGLSLAWSQHMDSAKNYSDKLISRFREPIETQMKNTSAGERVLLIISDQILHPLKILVDPMSRNLDGFGFSCFFCCVLCCF